MIVRVSVVLKSITLSLLGSQPFRFQWIRTLHGQKRYCACVGIWREEFNNQSEYLREGTVKWLHRSNAHDTKEIFGLARNFNSYQTLPSNHRIWGFGNVGFCRKMKTGVVDAKPLRKRTRIDKHGDLNQGHALLASERSNWCTDNIACDTCVFWEQYNSLKLSDIEAKCKRHPVHESNYSLKFSRLPLLGTLKSNNVMAKRTTKKGLLSQKKNKQTNKLYTRPSHFLYISCPFLHDHTKWKCRNSSFMDNVNKQRRNFYFSLWTWIWSLGVQLQEGSPTFDKVSG